MRRSLASLLVVVFGFLAFGGAAPGAAEESREIQIEREKAALRQKIQLADRRAKEVSKQIADSSSRKNSLEKQISSLSSQLTSAQQRLVNAEAQLGEARTELYSVESNLEILKARLQLSKRRFESRTRFAYKVGGSAGYVEMLIGAGDFRDFLSRLSFVKKVVSADRSRADALEHLSAELESLRAQIAGRKDLVAAQKVLIENEKQTIAGLKQGVQVSRQSIVGELSEQKGALTEVEKERAIYKQQMAKLEAESRSIAALLKARQKGQVFQAGSGIRLAWPTTGPVSSPFGQRTHPVFGDRRLHAGIDIAAPSGQGIIAAEAGTVVYSGLKGGYGNTVVIDHGNALATLYAHMSSISVSNGSKIARGAKVGGVGCTGYCTGPHLHFETRVNGEPRNPMGFY